MLESSTAAWMTPYFLGEAALGKISKQGEKGRTPSHHFLQAGWRCASGLPRLVVKTCVRNF